ncbi:hypothetical protein TREAZ_0062 [Leadbettera azotonutricia ZAS-9]|uniref:Uncharacterized protein n=1 Tax=Leadbettera azotonutricia (strain ATCC BAA-888 / DSM 13862 / ZAS-9) TaxID=545695 RepID=F5YFL5_LEAAZ|nr:hypothetical protein TREAZ_0062 [Leadbettera azotonutricia ZAS-9]
MEGESLPPRFKACGFSASPFSQGAKPPNPCNCWKKQKALAILKWKSYNGII